MTDFQSRPVPGNASKLSLWGKLRAALSGAATISAQLAGILALSVFVIITGWLIWQQYQFSKGGDFTHTTAKRDFLCNRHIFDLPQKDGKMIALNEGQQIIYDLYAMKERARQHAIPFDTLGKIKHYFLCANITEVTTTSVALEIVPETRSPIADLNASEQKTLAKQLGRVLSWERQEWEQASTLFDRTKDATESDQPQRKMIPDRIFEEWDLILIELSKFGQNALADAPKIAASEQNDLTENDVRLALKTPRNQEDFISTAHVLVVGADQDYYAAFDEVKKLRAALGQIYERPVTDADGNPTDQSDKVGFSLTDRGELNEYVSLFTIGSWKRTVVAFETSDDAEQALDLLQAAGKIRLDSYVRPVRNWCAARFEAAPRKEVPASMKHIKVFICDR